MSNHELLASINRNSEFNNKKMFYFAKHKVQDIRQAPHIVYPQFHISVVLLVLSSFMGLLYLQAGKMPVKAPGTTSRHGYMRRNKETDFSCVSFLEAEKPSLKPLLQVSSTASSVRIVSNTLS